MYDPRDGTVRYRIHFDDGGSGMRTRDEPLEPSAELVDGGGRYRVVRVEPAPNPQACSGTSGRSCSSDVRAALTLSTPLAKSEDRTGDRTVCASAPYAAYLTDATMQVCDGHLFPNTPSGIRTRATGVKGRRPRPLDDGGLAGG
jgi:hypothetical protein